MDKKTVFVKTDKGESEVSGQSDALYGDAKRILNLVDDESTVGDLTKRAPPSLRDGLQTVLQELVDGGYIRDMRAPAAEPKKPALKMATPAFKMATPKFAAPQAPTPPVVPPRQAMPARPAANAAAPAGMPNMNMPPVGSAAAKPEEPAKTNNGSDLDFSFILSGASQAPAAADQKKAEAEALAKARQEADAASLKAEQAAQFEAAAKAAKQKAYDDAKQRAQIEVAARARIEAETKLKQEAETARLQAEQAAQKARSESEAAKARIEAEVRARIEAEARVKQEAEAARLKAEREAEKLRLELEAAKAKAELEAKIRVEAEVRAKLEAEARIKREAEAERLRLEKERAEQEIARVKAEAERKLREEAELRYRAEVEARLRAEALAKEAELRRLQQESAGEIGVAAKEEEDPAEKLRQSFGQFKVNPDQQSPEFKLDNFSLLDTGKMAALTGQPVKPEVLPGAGSKVKAALEQRAQKEAEAQRLKAEQEAARLKAEQEAAARIKFEQEQAARIKVEQELMRLKAEQEARDRADAESQKLADQQAKQWEEGQRKAAIQAQAEIERVAQEAAAKLAKSKAKASRGPRRPLPLGKILGGVFALAVLAVFALPYVWPVDDYIAPLSKEISEQVHQPVQIRKISFALVPPRLELQSFSMGNAEELKVGTVELSFDFSALFAPVKSINKLELHDVVVAGATFDKALPWLQAAGASEKYPVTRMELKNVRVNSDQIKLPALNGRADFDVQGKFTHANLQTEDEKLSLEIQPQLNHLQLELNMREGNLPVLSRIKFSDLSMNAVLENGQLTISDFFAHIHGGTLTGKGLLNWMNGWKLQGQINAKSIELQRMFPNFGLSGELAGDVVVGMNSIALAQLDQDPHMEGTFEAKNGVISKLDIETISRFGARPGVAGHSNFSEMSGSIKADKMGQHIFLNKLALTASNVTGMLDVDATQQLSGKFMVDIKGQGNVPLQLSGSASQPVLQAGR